jgi:hypothetical protein
MRTVLWLVTLSLGLLAPGFCQAELLIYKGNDKINKVGDGGKSFQRYEVWLVMDRTNGNVAKIDYFSARGFKLYTVEEFQGFQTLTVEAGKGRTNSIIAQAQTSIDQSNQVTVTAVFLQGSNARLTVSHGSTLRFPKILDWNSQGVSPFPGTSLSQSWTETGVFVFNGSQTTYSNGHAETLAQAETRLVSVLQAKGYSEFALK